MVKLFGKVMLPPGVVIDTFRCPSSGADNYGILAATWFELRTAKLLTAMPSPKCTSFAPVRFEPVIVTSSSLPGCPEEG